MIDLKNMKKSDFYYELPQELIAQKPIEPRNASRLLKIDRNTGKIEHNHFYNLCDYLKKGDLLILNDSRVLPARIYGEKADNGSFIEFLLVEQRGNMEWEILCRPGKKAKIGTEFIFGGGKLKAVITDILEDGNRIAKFECEDNFFAALDEIGQMPLPPYITEKLIEEMGVNIAYVTLHVGLGTFRPVKEDKVLDHKMHREHYEMPKRTADLINQTKAAGGRVIAVGTTSCRTLESVATFYNEIKPCDGYTDIFIYPGYEFKVLDGLITNFHLPESTLIMLVSAFLGYDKTMNAYETAVEEKYRFFSFGDSMAIL